VRSLAFCRKEISRFAPGSFALQASDSNTDEEADKQHEKKELPLVTIPAQ
jgi:hypothetical protein